MSELQATVAIRRLSPPQVNMEQGRMIDPLDGDWGCRVQEKLGNRPAGVF